MFEIVLLIALVVLALMLVGLVLLQQGKGADMGASFGSGASQTLFGSQGSGNFLTKTTWTLAFLFFAICLALGYIARDQAQGKAEFDLGISEQAVERVPAVDVPESDVPTADVPADVGEAASDVPAAATEMQQAAEQMQDVPSAVMDAPESGADQ